MGVDYYKFLHVDRNSKDDDLKKAYKINSLLNGILTKTQVLLALLVQLNLLDTQLTSLFCLHLYLEYWSFFFLILLVVRTIVYWFHFFGLNILSLYKISLLIDVLKIDLVIKEVSYSDHDSLDWIMFEMNYLLVTKNNKRI